MERKFFYLLISLLFIVGCGETSEQSFDDNSGYFGSATNTRSVIENDELRSDVSGTYTVEACSSSGCYDLEADISGGELETIYFDNGGYVDDPSGDGWELSSLPDEAYEDAFEDSYDSDEYEYAGY